MSYRNLEIWRLAQRLTSEIHAMTLDMLPKHEMYEEGGQIRRSIKSVRSNIVEGYGRRRYKQDFMRFLTYAQASCDETTDHLYILKETGSLTDGEAFESIREKLDHLGRTLNKFTRAVESGHVSVREPDLGYGQTNENGRTSSIEHRESSIEDRASRIENRVSSIENRASSIEHRGSSIEDRGSSIQRPASDEEKPH